MRRLHLLVEGQTEEVLARELIGPHLEESGWIVSWSVVETKRSASGEKFRGGVAAWGRIRREISLMLRSRFDRVTTIVDYYGFPANAPGMRDRPDGPPLERVCHVERALAEDVADDRFLPHLTLHETESWVFAAATELAELYEDPKLGLHLAGVVESAGGPETSMTALKVHHQNAYKIVCRATRRRSTVRWAFKTSGWLGCVRSVRISMRGWRGWSVDRRDAVALDWTASVRSTPSGFR